MHIKLLFIILDYNKLKCSSFRLFIVMITYFLTINLEMLQDVCTIEEMSLMQTENGKIRSD